MAALSLVGIVAVAKKCLSDALHSLFKLGELTRTYLHAQAPAG